MAQEAIKCRFQANAALSGWINGFAIEHKPKGCKKLFLLQKRLVALRLLLYRKPIHPSPISLHWSESAFFNLLPVPLSVSKRGVSPAARHNVA